MNVQNDMTESVRTRKKFIKDLIQLELDPGAPSMASLALISSLVKMTIEDNKVGQSRISSSL